MDPNHQQQRIQNLTLTKRLFKELGDSSSEIQKIEEMINTKTKQSDSSHFNSNQHLQRIRDKLGSLETFPSSPSSSSSLLTPDTVPPNQLGVPEFEEIYQSNFMDPKTTKKKRDREDSSSESEDSSSESEEEEEELSSSPSSSSESESSSDSDRKKKKKKKKPSSSSSSESESDKKKKKSNGKEKKKKHDEKKKDKMDTDGDQKKKKKERSPLTLLNSNDQVSKRIDMGRVREKIHSKEGLDEFLSICVYLFKNRPRLKTNFKQNLDNWKKNLSNKSERWKSGITIKTDELKMMDVTELGYLIHAAVEEAGWNIFEEKGVPRPVETEKQSTSKAKKEEDGSKSKKAKIHINSVSSEEKQRQISELFAIWRVFCTHVAMKHLVPDWDGLMKLRIEDEKTEMDVKQSIAIQYRDFARVEAECEILRHEFRSRAEELSRQDNHWDAYVELLLSLGNQILTIEVDESESSRKCHITGKQLQPQKGQLWKITFHLQDKDKKKSVVVRYFSQEWKDMILAFYNVMFMLSNIQVLSDNLVNTEYKGDKNDVESMSAFFLDPSSLRLKEIFDGFRGAYNKLISVLDTPRYKKLEEQLHPGWFY